MENEITKEIISYLLYVVGTLLLFGGGLGAYIFNRHVAENDCESAKNREDHNRLHERIDRITE